MPAGPDIAFMGKQVEKAVNVLRAQSHFGKVQAQGGPLLVVGIEVHHEEKDVLLKGFGIGENVRIARIVEGQVLEVVEGTVIPADFVEGPDETLDIPGSVPIPDLVLVFLRVQEFLLARHRGALADFIAIVNAVGSREGGGQGEPDLEHGRRRVLQVPGQDIEHAVQSLQAMQMSLAYVLVDFEARCRQADVDKVVKSNLSAMPANVDAIIPVSQISLFRNDANFWDAQEAANRELEKEGLFITHLFEANQVFLRRDWEQHIIPISCPPLRWLRLFRPATLDLVLTKMMRGDDPQDMADIAFLIRHDRLTPELIESALAEVVLPDLVELRDAFECAKPLVRELVRHAKSAA